MYSSVSGSFNDLVMKLREKLDARFPNDHKLIIAYYYNNAVNLTSTAVANMNQTYNAITLNQIKNRSAQSKNDGMGAREIKALCPFCSDKHYHLLSLIHI